MNEQKAVHISPDTGRALLQMLQHSGDVRSIEQIVDAALKAWLAAATVATPAAAVAATRGYQWKSLFLPEGTLLRVCLRGQYTVALVVGDRIVFQGEHYSPRQFVMHVTGQVRNAWLECWIRCPGDARWHLADTRRHILRRARPTSAAAAAPVTAKPPCIEFRALLRASYLRRTDCVLDDQPDLSTRLPAGRGFGRFGAGRPGPRDRRAPARFIADSPAHPANPANPANPASPASPAS
jgi:hypothetical protein